MRSHGHTLEELFRLRNGEVNKRIPDVVVFPRNHDDVVKLVAAAVRCNVCLIPIGGGIFNFQYLFLPVSLLGINTSYLCWLI